MEHLLLISSLLAASILLFVAWVLVAVFLRVTTGSRGLRQRIERLFRLPERTRGRAGDHYYQAYWRTR